MRLELSIDEGMQDKGNTLSRSSSKEVNLLISNMKNWITNLREISLDGGSSACECECGGYIFAARCEATEELLWLNGCRYPRLEVPVDFLVAAVSVAVVVERLQCSDQGSKEEGYRTWSENRRSRDGGQFAHCWWTTVEVTTGTEIVLNLRV